MTKQVYLRRAIPSIPQTKIHIFKGYPKNDAWKNVGWKNVGDTCECTEEAYLMPGFKECNDMDKRI